MKKSIIENLKQVLLIVFSVVLDIFLSDRLEERKNKKEADLLLSKLKSEISDNQKILETYTPYHIELVKNLDSLSSNQEFLQKFIQDKSTFFSQLLTKGSLMNQSPSADAWDIAKSHPLIVHFDYDELLILSKIYNQQESTYVSIPNLVELLLSSDFNDPKQAKANLQAFRNQLREIASREVQLLNYFKEAEKTLELERK